MNKEVIISHCRQMDKSDVYEWIAEDELKIKDLQQRIDKAINILKGLRLIIPIQHEIKEGIDLSLEILGGKE
jgi:hypothetical protein